MQTDLKSAGLTEKRIRDAQPGATTFVIWDRVVKGFGLRVTPNSVKAYVLDYRADGRKRRFTLARAGELSLKDARERAGAELVAIRNGEADPLKRRRDIQAAPTVNDGLDLFFSDYVPRRIADGRMAPRTAKDYRAQADRTIRPGIGTMKIAEVTRHDIERTVAKRAPVQRNRTLALLSRLFTWFEHTELRPQHTNPVRGIEKAKEEPRDRVLAPSEIQALGEALAGMDDLFAAAAIRFLLFTGWRAGEAMSLQWGHVDVETATITLPTTKTGRDVRPVGALALALLADLPRVAGNPFVFAGGSTKAITYSTLRRRFGEACEQAGIADTRLHDVRRTVATSAAAHGVSVFMLRDLLNHKTVAMANRYARRAGTALQEAQDTSAGRMMALLDGKSRRH